MDEAFLMQLNFRGIQEYFKKPPSKGLKYIILFYQSHKIIPEIISPGYFPVIPRYVGQLINFGKFNQR